MFFIFKTVFILLFRYFLNTEKKIRRKKRIAPNKRLLYSNRKIVRHDLTLFRISPKKREVSKSEVSRLGDTIFHENSTRMEEIRDG